MLRNTSKIYNKIIVVLLCATMIFFYGCKDTDTSEVEDYLETKKLPTAYAYNVRTLGSDSGHVRFIMVTKELQEFTEEKEPYTLFPQGFDFERLSNAGVPESSIACKYATYFKNTGLWELKDSVVAYNLDGDKFETELLYWDREKEIVHTDKFVTVTRGEEVMEGYGMDAKQDFSKYQIRDISSVFYVEVDE